MRKFIVCILSFLLIFTLIGCSKDDKISISDLEKSLSIELTIENSDFTLPTKIDSKLSNSITWKSDNEVIKIGGLNSDGKSYVVTVTPELTDTTVKLTATITTLDNNKNVKKDFTVTVKARTVTLAEVKEALTLGDLNQVADNFELPAKVTNYDNSSIIWATSDTSILSIATKDATKNTYLVTVTRPKDENATVKITAMISIEGNDNTSSKDFNVIVLKEGAAVVDPDPTSISTIASVVALTPTTSTDIGKEVAIQGKVVAYQYKGYWVADNTGYILVFLDEELTETNAPAIGDTVKVIGNVATYGESDHFTSQIQPKSFEKVTTTITPLAAVVKSIGSFFTSPASTWEEAKASSVFGKVYTITGKLRGSGYYWYIDGESDQWFRLNSMASSEGLQDGANITANVLVRDIYFIDDTSEYNNFKKGTLGGIILSIQGQDDPDPDIDPDPSTDIITTSNAKKASNETQVSIQGVITAVNEKGFFVQDASGTMYVYLNATHEYEVGNKVTVTGTKGIYKEMPQITAAPAPVVTKEDNNATVNPVNEMTIEQFTTKTTADTDFFGTILKLKGTLKTRTAYNSTYCLEELGKVVGIDTKYSVSTTDLDTLVDKYIEAVVVVYNYDGDWRVLYIKDAKEANAPEVTTEQKFTAVKTDLTTKFNDKNVNANLTLPTTGLYSSTISWASNNASITNTGVYTAPAEDTIVKLTATITIGTETSTLEISVKALKKVETGDLHVIINQIFGGGGNNGAIFTNDFIELYNPTSTDVDLTGWTLQYSSKTGIFEAKNSVALKGTIKAKGYYLIQCAAGGTVTNKPLPTPEAKCEIAMSKSDLKVALASNSTMVASPTDTNVIDFVGVGAANLFEGTAAAPVLDNTVAAIRNNFSDTNNNANDFTKAAPNPHNGVVAAQ